MKKLNNKGFAPLMLVGIVVLVLIVGATGYYVYNSNKNTNKTLDNAAKSQGEPQKSANTTTNNSTTSTTNNSNNYLVIKEWGLKFKVPSSITDVRYHIFGDKIAFYAKPVGYTVEYRADYEKLSEGNPQYALGILYRSTESSKNIIDIPVAGKKIGNYYYYTSHAFSNLATGAGPNGLYFDAFCDQDTSNSTKCDQLTKAEGAAFEAINQGNTSLLDSIEPV